MFRHNLILTIRKFKRNKISFLINLVGLSTGLACVLMIFLWVNDELGVDKFHEKDAQLFQVVQNYEFPNGIETTALTSLLLGDALAATYPEIETMVNVSGKEDSPIGILSLGEQAILAEGIFAAKNYFQVFSLPLIEGNATDIIKDKNSIAISKDLAIKLFNDTQVIGKMLAWKNDWWATDFVVSGVFENLPTNATQQFDFVLSNQYFWENEHAATWNGDYVDTYLVLKEGTNIKAFNERIAGFMKTQTAHGDKTTLFVQRFSEKYLHGNYENGKIVGGKIAYVKLFSLIALFILLIACINFMNLSTAQASTKMKEIGVKKAIGARRQSLIVQFLGEALLMVAISAVIALALVNVLMPQFNQITGKSLGVNFDLSSLLIFLGITITTGLLAGSYSSFYLSGFNPIAILKGKMNHANEGAWVRKGLVIFQFSLSLIFIVGVLVIHQQMEYIQTKNLGYNRANILSFERPNFREKSEVFLTTLENIPGVEQVGRMFDNILNGEIGQSGYSWQGGDSESGYLFKSPIVSYNAIETLDMKLLEGRTFSKDFQNEKEKIIINETALKKMGLVDPIGQKISYGHLGGEREIIGVVKDFHYGSIHQKIAPLIFRFSAEANNIMVKVKAGTEQSTIAAIEKVFKEFHPAYPLSFTFLDADYQALYESESRVAILSKYFSGLAILISCLGLFGLAMFTAERRKKEIGIRKVLGASVFSIVQMLTKDFSKTVIIAIFIAIPISYLIANDWLANFAYSIDLSWWYFIVPGLLVLLIAWFTVGVQTVQAASVNPIHALKQE